MYTQQDKYAAMQSKLREGLDLLARTSEEDRSNLGVALIKLHGALEDFVRLEIVRKVPQLQDEVEDATKTRWKQLIDYGKEYLGLTENDARLISKANNQRQAFAHGGNYDGSRYELVKYAELVQRWCNPGQQFRNLTFVKPAASSPAAAPIRTATYQPEPKSVPAPTPARRVQERRPTPRYGMPWYRSTLFLFLSFFLLPPLWAILILTDRSQGCFARLVATAMLAVTVLAGIGFYYYFGGSINSLPDLIHQFRLPSISTLVPGQFMQATATETPMPPSTVQTVPPGKSSPTEGSCTIIWVEDQSNDLAGKNRSMVWEEIVMTHVKGSGMTERQFYNLVVEHNPDLVKDGYEFKTGKTYLLPECQ